MKTDWKTIRRITRSAFIAQDKNMDELLSFFANNPDLMTLNEIDKVYSSIYSDKKNKKTLMLCGMIKN